MNVVNKLALATLITLFLNFPQAQAQNASGAANGNDNRDQPSLQKDITPPDLSLESLQDSFQQLLTALRQLSANQHKPVSKVDADFWTKFTPADQVLLIKYDEYLAELVDNSTKEVELALVRIQNEIAVTASIRQEIAQYKERGIGKALKATLKERRKNLVDNSEALVAHAASLLLFQELYSIGLTRFKLPEENALYFGQCQTTVCVDLMGQKFIAYLASADQVLDSSVTILGKTKTFGHWFNRNARYTLQTVSALMKEYKRSTKNQQFTFIYNLTNDNLRTKN